ncbi:MAG: hypothetical protein LH628_27080 [Microcoleus sp. CAN_BIN18]|nr:hypothetical protein [Microcoleus sp. CAN_BIN18]
MKTYLGATEVIDRDRTAIPIQSPRNRVSATIFASSPRFWKETRFLTPHEET